MQGGALRIVCLGRPDRSDAASRVTREAVSLGSEGVYVIPEEGSSSGEFDQGAIDWRGELGSAQWLITTSSTVLEGGARKSAWGASIAFAELEGSRTVMIVDKPDDGSRIEESWGSVIERIRQVHILFIENGVIGEIARIEETGSSEILKQIRESGLVPIVCSIDESRGLVGVEHSLGGFETVIEGATSAERWLAGFLSELPNSGPGPSGIEAAASRKLE